jgi:hypothetical protein
VRLTELGRVEAEKLPPEVAVVLVTQAASEASQWDGRDLVSLQPTSLSLTGPIPPRRIDPTPVGTARLGLARDLQHPGVGAPLCVRLR